MQKAYLQGPLQIALQIRLPGKNVFAVVDARSGAAVLASARPAGPDDALPSQAALRHALAGARLLSAGLELIPGEPKRPPRAVLHFETPRGPRTLVAESWPRPLLLLVGEASRIVWASGDKEAGPLPVDRRPGAALERGEPLPDAPARSPAGDAPQADAARALRETEAAALAARRAALLHKLKARAKKLERTLAAVAGDLQRADGAVDLQRNAELLLPAVARIARGAREAELPDWSQLDGEGRPALVRVQLDPALSVQEQAARWLKTARRMRAARARIDARHGELARSLAAARSLLERASLAADPAALRAVEEDARASGTLEQSAGAPDANAPRGKRPKERVPFRAFRSANGARILVGRNARDNDALTLKWARGNDVWLHARGVQGAHVLLPDAGEAPDSTALSDAALLAAHFSSARSSDGAEVAWTRKKYVRKVKGAAAGAVQVTQEKVLRIRRDEARLATLLASEEQH